MKSYNQWLPYKDVLEREAQSELASLLQGFLHEVPHPAKTPRHVVRTRVWPHRRAGCRSREGAEQHSASRLAVRNEQVPHGDVRRLGDHYARVLKRYLDLKYPLEKQHREQLAVVLYQCASLTCISFTICPRWFAPARRV